MLPDHLRKAVNLLQAGQTDSARGLLAEYLQKDPKSETGWFLLSLAVSDPRQQQDCLRQVLRLNPQHPQAQARLKDLSGGAPTPTLSPAPASPPPAPATHQDPASGNPPGFSFDWNAAPDDSFFTDAERQALQATTQGWEAAPSPPPFTAASAETGDEDMPWLKDMDQQDNWWESYQAMQAGDVSQNASGESPSAGPTQVEAPLNFWEQMGVEAASAAEPPASPPTASVVGDALPDWLDPEADAPPPVPPISQAPAAVPAQAAPARTEPEAPAAAVVSGASPAAAPAARSSQPPARPARPKKRRAGRDHRLIFLVGGLVLLCLCVLAGGWMASDFLGMQAQSEVPELAVIPDLNTLATTAAPAAGKGFPTLPPTWTPTHTPTITPIPSITPTPEPSLTPTLIPPIPTVEAQMARIEIEVSGLRGLQIRSQVPRYLVPREQARLMFSPWMLDQDGLQRLEDQKQVLVALGLVPPTYDLSNYTLNRAIDGIGGVYLPWQKEIYILGFQFGGLERYVYAHEYSHALVDQHYAFSEMGLYPQCQGDLQRCQAIKALIEGDAMLAMSQWAQQYATIDDRRQIARFSPPAQALPENTPPPAYVIQDLNFPYEYGLQFVQHLHRRGNWTEVNWAYDRLPASTEQILHPEKYLASEAPLIVEDSALEPALGSGWRLLESNTLGEWKTFLVLAYGADKTAQRNDASAWRAAGGWGGDHYQVYWSDERQQSAMAVHWAWDSTVDATEFRRLMTEHLHARFLGARMNRPGAPCWQVSGYTTCLFSQDRLSLWLLAPDEPTLDAMLALFPDFSQSQ